MLFVNIDLQIVQFCLYKKEQTQPCLLFFLCFIRVFLCFVILFQVRNIFLIAEVINTHKGSDGLGDLNVFDGLTVEEL